MARFNVSNIIGMNLQLFASTSGRFDRVGVDLSGCASWADIAAATGMTDHFVKIPLYADIHGDGIEELVPGTYIPGILETGEMRGDKTEPPAIIRDQYSAIEHEFIGDNIIDKLMIDHDMTPLKGLYYDNKCKTAITLESGTREFLGENFSITIVVTNSFDASQKFALHCVPVDANGNALMLELKHKQHYVFKHTKQVAKLVPEVGTAVAQFEAYLDELETELTRLSRIPMSNVDISYAIDTLWPMAAVKTRGGSASDSINLAMSSNIVKNYGAQAEGTALKLVYMANDVANHHYIRTPKDIDHAFLLNIAGCSGTPQVLQTVIDYLGTF